MTRIPRICPCPARRHIPPVGVTRPSVARREIGGRGHFVAGVFLLRLFHPRRERLLAYDPDRNRHEGVILPAQFGALSVIDTSARRLEPSLVDAAGNGVDLDPEGR